MTTIRLRRRRFLSKSRLYVQFFSFFLCLVVFFYIVLALELYGRRAKAAAAHWPDTFLYALRMHTEALEFTSHTHAHTLCRSH